MMRLTRQHRLLLGLAVGGGLLWWLTRQSNNGTNTSDATSFLSDPVAAVTDAISSAVSGWQNVQQGPTWVPVIESIGAQNGLPALLLSRIAYQESRFREEVIRGTKPSTAGALGMMQMMPAYFQSVRVPTPYTDADVQAQIQEAANLMSSLHAQFGDWSLAIAAYNAGAGNVRKYGNTIPPFAETQSYVAAVMADVPALAGVA